MVREAEEDTDPAGSQTLPEILPEGDSGWYRQMLNHASSQSGEALDCSRYLPVRPGLPEKAGEKEGFHERSY